MYHTALPRRIAVILTVLTGLVLVVGQVPASGAAGDAGADGAALVMRRNSAAARANNWFVLDDPTVSFARTHDLSNAKPISWAPDVDALSRSAETVPQVQAPPVSFAPRLPSTAERSGRSPAGRSFFSHIPFIRTEIVDPTDYPFVVHGKVFLDFGGGIGLCSGTVVTSTNSSVVATAAHCLMDPVSGATPQAIAFAPGYRLNSAPFGFWDAEALWVTPEWASSVASGSADPRHDIGMFVLRPDGNDQRIGDVLGTRGISFNQPPLQLFDSFGYPSASPFDGERLWLCDSETSDLLGLFGSPQPHGIGCDMTPGSSGGGWVLTDENQNEFVNSVNSFGLSGHPKMMYGPQFGSSALNVYNNASNYDGTVDPTNHKMTVSIKLSRHLVVSGTMKAKDGYAPCTRSAPIKVFKKNRSASKAATGGRVVKKTMTDIKGKFRMNVPDKPGKYYVSSPKGNVDTANSCGATKSVVKTHGH